MTRLLAGLTLAAALAATGCGGGEGAQADGADAEVRVYSSFSLPSENGLVRAQQLALADAERRAGGFEVELVSLNTPGGDQAAFEAAERNAARAGKDKRAVAYMGESNSDLTGRSITRTNQVGLLHVSPSSTYPGFTKSVGAQPGEPAKFRSSGPRNFARVIPADDVQARGIVEAMRREGVRRVFILDDRSVYGTGLSRLVREHAEAAGIATSVDPAIREAANSGPAEVAKAMRASGVAANAFLGCLDARVASEFFEAGPELLLFTGDCQSKPVFFQQLDDPRESVRITAPAPDLEDPRARRFAQRYEARWGEPPEPQAYFAYEAMALILDAIRRAGERGDERAAVREAFFATRDRRSIVGEYSIDRAGDTTLRTVGLFHVRGHKLAYGGLLTAR